MEQIPPRNGLTIYEVRVVFSDYTTLREYTSMNSSG